MTDAAPRDRPFAPSCERNRAPILAVLARVFADRHDVLEVGSGTGQHAVHFAAAMPWLRWQCSDRAEALPGMRAWLDDVAFANTPAPVALDVALGPWPTPAAAAPRPDAPARFDAAFTANTLHIMGWPEVEACFAGLDAVLADDAILVVYGPFNVAGAFTSESNRAFDAWLKARDPHSGIRDLEAVEALAASIGLRRTDLVEMPSNNLCVVWRGAAR